MTDFKNNVLSFLSLILISVSCSQGCVNNNQGEPSARSEGYTEAPLRERSLPLAKELIGLTTPEGESLAYTADARADLLPLLSFFQWQQTTTFCGIASAVTVLNALKISAPLVAQYNYQVFTQDNFFQPTDRKMASREEVQKNGLTLSQLGALLSSHGAKVHVYPSNITSREQFKSIAIENLKNKNDSIIVNYNRKSAFQEGGGHHSPLAAYHSKADRFLILDVAQHKYEPVWIRSEDLWNAMHTTDSTDPNIWRGFLTVARNDL
ncbi:MAG: phytochelatin synthase family protein [Pseudomonadota bacterium]